MKRKVLIIINPGKVRSDNYCNGVNVDSEKYDSFFKSSYGGCYSDDEVEIMKRPSVLDLKIQLLSIKNYDFSIIIFCGHGFFSQITSSNILELNDDEDFDS